MRLFISYAPADEPLVSSLAAELGRYHDVWYDREQRTGRDWQQAVLERVDWCECFLYALSPESLASRRCIRQYQKATQLGKPVILVRIQADVTVPDGRQYVDFVDGPFDTALVSLVRVLEDVEAVVQRIGAIRAGRADLPGSAPSTRPGGTPPPRPGAPSQPDAPSRPGAVSGGVGDRGAPPAAAQPGVSPAPRESADEAEPAPRRRGTSFDDTFGEGSEAEEEALPDWLRGEEPPPQAAAEEEALPDWLRDEESPSQAAEPPTSMESDEEAAPRPGLSLDGFAGEAPGPAKGEAEKGVRTKPEFSAFYPGLVEPGQSYALMTFVHGADAIGQVRGVAAGFAGLMGELQESGTAASRLAVDVGDLITFVPRVAGITFAPAEQTVVWRPPYQYATFLFATPSPLAGNLEGRVLVYQGPLIIGEIPVRMQVASISQGIDQQGTFEPYDPVFASYSHRDRPVMEFFRQLRMSMGQRMLVDIYDLRAGEHWSERLLEMIDESAVFQLFWSRHSAESAYCRQEWEHALRYGEARPRFIQPVWWQHPMPDPPPELADLHFQKVAIPAGTWIELTGERVRDWFRRG